ncbi:alpha/beta fold hydrolase [Planctomycetota bacterium]
MGYFKSGSDKLFYSYAIPHRKVRKVGILFVHAGGGNRLGPHRMFVELANRFRCLGYPTFRFDFRGCGDSTGDVLQSNITTEISDLAEAVKFFVARADLENIVLFGISRGSRICFTATATYNLPVIGMILLSAPVSSGKAALKSFSAHLKEYIWKLKEPRYLWKFLSGRSNINQIVKTLVVTLQLSQRYKSIEETQFKSNCSVLFIYGGGDPTAKEANKYYADRCIGNKMPYTCHTVENANHSFFHYKWKQEIFTISKQWLENTLK